MVKEIDIDKIEELSPGTIYHINLPAKTPYSVLEAFTAALKVQGLKALVTIGEVKVESFTDLISGLTEEKKDLVREALGQKTFEFNPKDHEQTK